MVVVAIGLEGQRLEGALRRGRFVAANLERAVPSPIDGDRAVLGRERDRTDVVRVVRLRRRLRFPPSGGETAGERRERTEGTPAEQPASRNV
ncbi:hypothetical protein [Natrinema versiforme]|uniref:Uncharacterized protein n=1 Tax=Natrinema versiforme JCM 10478 TaxID=1227496 RepID=L9YBG0_9EURY|nr:hypothetical protein [Natrinema versiforme]ELY70258.1 hypothetical protein C489_02891 [Natrinema versiforme JCM 10478]